jgi:hypothetical protein
MAGLPGKRPRPKVQGSLHHSFLAAHIITALATVHRDVRGCSSWGWSWGGCSSICENPPLLGPLSHLWVSIGLFFFFLSFFLFRIFVVVFASAPESASICSFSLSLLHLDASAYLAIFSAHLPQSVSATKQRQVQIWQHPKGFPGGVVRGGHWTPGVAHPFHHFPSF